MDWVIEGLLPRALGNLLYLLLFLFLSPFSFAIYNLYFLSHDLEQILSVSIFVIFTLVKDSTLLTKEFLIARRHPSKIISVSKFPISIPEIGFDHLPIA